MEKHVSREVIQRLVDAGLSHKEISFQLQTLFPEKGLSERSVRRYCKTHGVKKPCKTVVDQVVHDAIFEVSTGGIMKYCSRLFAKQLAKLK